MFDIVVRKGDTLPVIGRTIVMNGAPVDLTGYTMQFVVMDTDGVEIFRHSASVVSPGTAGKVTYQWTTADSDALNTPGVRFAYFQGTQGSDTITFPNNSVLSLLFTTTSSHEYSYSGDPSKRPIDRVRFLIQDTDMSKATFTDSELNFMLAEEGNAYAAAAMAAETQAGSFASLSDKTVGPLSIRYGDQANRWSKLASSLRARGGRSSGAKAINGNVVRDPLFSIGMHDNGGSDLLTPTGSDQP